MPKAEESRIESAENREAARSTGAEGTCCGGAARAPSESGRFSPKQAGFSFAPLRALRVAGGLLPQGVLSRSAAVAGAGADVRAAPPDGWRGTRAARFLIGPGLLVFLLTALAGYEGFLLLTIFGPTEGGWLGDFVRDFQLWCYRGDPRTGGISWLAVSVMMFEPIFVVGLAALLWRQAFVRLREPGVWLAHWREMTAALLVVLVGAGGLVYYARLDAVRAQEIPPFPGERIRVRLELPDMPLVDQKGKEFRFAALGGRVVLVTGVYATCTTACPEIFLEVKKLLEELPAAERADMSVVALSLNPEYETAQLMDLVTEARGLRHPEFRYVNGRRPEEMRELLTRLQFAATRNPETGLIDHANLFLLVDRSNHIAYRFTLDPRHRAWMHAALRSLLLESHAGSPTAP